MPSKFADGIILRWQNFHYTPSPATAMAYVIFNELFVAGKAMEINMIFFVLVLLLLIFNKMEISKPGEFNKDYISPDGTLAVKGIFVALILLSHGKGYIELGGIYDEPYIAMQNHLNQMVVAMFLFYSGFGMMESMKKKQFAYVQSVATKRFPNLLLNYDLAVLLFFVLGYIIGRPYTAKQLLIALTAWEGIGNSSWYIFAILVMYIAVMIAFLPKKFNQSKALEIVSIVVLTALSIAVVWGLKKVGRPGFCYNTIILFPLGFWYSYFKNTIERLLMKNDIIYSCTLAVVVIAYILAFMHRWDRLLIFEIWAMLFCALMILLTMKISLQNEVLKFLGKHIFSIYILQRIPMIFLDHYGVSDRHKYIFLIASFALTTAMAVVFEFVTGKISSAIWKPKKKLN